MADNWRDWPPGERRWEDLGSHEQEKVILGQLKRIDWALRRFDPNIKKNLRNEAILYVKKAATRYKPSGPASFGSFCRYHIKDGIKKALDNQNGQSTSIKTEKGTIKIYCETMLPLGAVNGFLYRDAFKDFLLQNGIDTDTDSLGQKCSKRFGKRINDVLQKQRECSENNSIICFCAESKLNEIQQAYSEYVDLQSRITDLLKKAVKYLAVKAEKQHEAFQLFIKYLSQDKYKTFNKFVASLEISGTPETIRRSYQRANDKIKTYMIQNEGRQLYEQAIKIKQELLQSFQELGLNINLPMDELIEILNREFEGSQQPELLN